MNPPSAVAEASPVDAVEDALISLELTSRRLRQIAGFVPLLTFVHLALFPVGLSTRALLMSTEVGRYTFLASEVSLFFYTLLSLLRFDRLAQSGDALVQELSDELEWEPPTHRYSLESRYLASKNEAEAARARRPGLRWRLAFREFALASRLPFGTSRSSGALYMAVNVVLFLLNAGFQTYSLLRF